MNRIRILSMRSAITLTVVLIAIVLISLFAYNQSNKFNETCASTLDTADQKYDMGDLEGASDGYQDFINGCTNNTFLKPRVDYDEKEITSRMKKAEIFGNAKIDCAQNNEQLIDSAIERYRHYLYISPNGVYKQETEEELERCLQKRKESTLAKYTNPLAGSDVIISDLYDDICTGGIPNAEVLSVIKEEKLQPGFWFYEAHLLKTDLKANVPAEFRIAVCFEAVNETVVETCTYSESGQAQGLMSSTVRKVVNYKVVLKDTLSGKTIGEYDKLISSAPPGACPLTMSAGTLFDEVIGEREFTAQDVLWLEEQIRGLR